MSQNKDTGDPEVIEFEDLDAEDNQQASSREEQLATFLKDKLSEEDFGAAAKILGVETEDLSNAELLEKLTELLQGKKEEKTDEPPEDEKEMQDYKTFIKDCMAKGKTMEECQAAYKEKYPEPKEKMEEGTEDLESKDETLEELSNRIAELEKSKLELEISNEVSGLVQAKHLSPRQAAPVVKLGAGMTPEMRTEFFNLFRTQKYTVSEDKGGMQNHRPGETPDTIDAETRKRILQEQGLADLIDERGIKRRNN